VVRIPLRHHFRLEGPPNTPDVAQDVLALFSVECISHLARHRVPARLKLHEGVGGVKAGLARGDAVDGVGGDRAICGKVVVDEPFVLRRNL
jgi:hypothetical protein